MAAHPSKEEFTAYCTDPENELYTHVGEHIDSCNTCKKEYQLMRKLTDQLKQQLSDDFHLVGETHLTDEEIIGYINNTLDEQTTHKIQTHLKECGSCMKSVLRHRAYRAEHQAGGEQQANEKSNGSASSASSNDSFHNNISSGSGASNKVNVVDLTNQARKRKPYLRYFAIPVALAATVLLSVMVTLRFSPIKEPDQVAQIPADVIDKNQSTFETSTSSPVLPVASTTKNGINWYGGYVETTAIGTADMSKMKNRVQAEIVAEKTARHLAYAQLAEILNGVQVTSNTTYQDLLLKVDDLNVQSEGFIRGAKVVKKNIEWDKGVPKASVTLRAPLYGQNSVKSLIETVVPEVQFKHPELQQVKVERDNDYSSQFTNVIIDATNIEFTPALFLSMLSATSQYVGESSVFGNQSFQFFPDVQSATTSKYAGTSPAVVKALSSSKTGSLVLNDSDALLTQAIYERRKDDSKNPILVVF